MKTIRLTILIVLIAWVMFAHAIKPSPVPTTLQEESGNAEVQYKGQCEYEYKIDNCMIGYDVTTDTVWLLLFTQQGVLFKIISKKGDDVPQVRWVHPEKMV